LKWKTWTNMVHTSEDHVAYSTASFPLTPTLMVHNISFTD